MQYQLRQILPRKTASAALGTRAMSTVVQLSTPRAAAPKQAAPKALYEIGEIPPLGHVPEKMYAWAIRTDRNGTAGTSMQILVLSTLVFATEKLLYLVTTGGGKSY